MVPHQFLRLLEVAFTEGIHNTLMFFNGLQHALRGGGHDELVPNQGVVQHLIEFAQFGITCCSHQGHMKLRDLIQVFTYLRLCKLIEVKMTDLLISSKSVTAYSR